MMKRLMLSVVVVLLAALAVAPAGAAEPGDRDITFAGDGIVENNVGPLSHGGTALAIQPDGKILLAGDKQDAAVIARYNPNGMPDTTFGLSANGVVTVKRNPASEDEEATGMALLDTGRIIVAMYDDSNVDSALFALNPSGAQITTFGVGGFVDTAYNGYTLRGMTLETIPGSGFYALSTFFDTSDNVYKAVLQKYRPNGRLNPNFGTAGSVVISFTGIWTFGNDLIIMPDGDIMVVGRLGNSNGWLARYNPDGTPETTFGGGDGIQESTFMIYGVDARDDGRFVVGGAASNTDAVMAGYTASGAFDTTFGGGDGIILIDFTNSNSINRVAVHPDGSAYGVGSTGGPSGESGFIVGLTPAGILNFDFAPLSGVQFYSQGTYSALSDVVIDPQGRVLASGHGDTGGDNHYTLIRYLHALVINPSMEINDDVVNRVPDFWTIANGTVNDRIRCGAANFPANTGNCTVALVADSGVTTILAHRSRAAGEAGDDYIVSAALATRNLTRENQLSVIVSFHNGATVVGKEVFQIDNLNSLEYDIFTANVTAPGDYTSIRIRFRLRGPSGRVLIDDVTIEEGVTRAADSLLPMPPAP